MNGRRALIISCWERIGDVKDLERSFNLVWGLEKSNLTTLRSIKASIQDKRRRMTKNRRIVDLKDSRNCSSKWTNLQSVNFRIARQGVTLLELD